jgi:hypothetical protein
VVEGLAIMALDKHCRQPALFASPLRTQSVPSALALRSILVVAGQTQRAQPRPHRGQKRARVRYRCLSLASGSAMMGSGVGFQPMPCVGTYGILYFIPSCVNKKSCNFSVYN